VQYTRTAWIRALRLYRTSTDDGADLGVDGDVHAQSRFRSVRHPERFALYSLHEPWERGPQTPGDHTLVTVREFRRVPLYATTLGLILFAARAGREAAVVATLAHFAERALSLYQPPYLLLARSFEQPGITMMLTGVREGSVLEAAGASAFSMDQLMPELSPLLSVDPEWYGYVPEREPNPLFAPV